MYAQYSYNLFLRTCICRRIIEREISAEPIIYRLVFLTRCSINVIGKNGFVKVRIHD